LSLLRYEPGNWAFSVLNVISIAAASPFLTEDVTWLMTALRGQKRPFHNRSFCELNTPYMINVERVRQYPLQRPAAADSRVLSLSRLSWLSLDFL
jgi:hypothetical protein